MSLEFTKRQQTAIDVKGSAVVRAGAGSGKTSVLTHRYVRALDEQLRPGQIVAITFTNKAAAEMRDRIRRAVADMDSSNVDTEGLRDEAADAPINTIHAFCTSLLREFPVEAGVDPAFEVLDESAARQLKRAAADNAIDAIAEDPNHPASRPLDLLLSFYARHQLTTMLLDVSEQTQYLTDHAVRLLDGSPGDLVTAWHKWLIGELRHVLDAMARSHAAHEAATLLPSLLQECTCDTDQAYQTAQAVLGALRAAETLEPKAMLDAAQMLATHALKADGQPYSMTKRGAKKNWTGDSLARVRQLLGPLLESLEPFGPLLRLSSDENTELVARLVHALWQLVREVCREYDTLKGSGRALDFDDQELKAIALLESERTRHVLDALRRRYSLLLVDEGQDLNLRQYRLITLLAGDGAAGAGPAVFVVGDPQQSIFAFRNADVRLFDRARRELVAPNSSAFCLPESFRSTRGLVSFANALFGSVLTGGEPFEVEYSPLTATEHRPLDSAIELLLTASSDHHVSTGDVRAQQAALVAERIEALREGPEQVFADTARTALRPAKYADVAVLIRTRQYLPFLVDAFRRRAIPYAVYKGIGFFQRQEVRDIFTCFRFLADPSRDLDLAGLLRAPLFGVSDDALFLLARNRGERPLCDVLLEPAPVLASLAQADREALARAAHSIPTWRALVDLVKPSRLLHCILDDTGAWGTYAATGAGATMAKLLRILRGWEMSARSLSQVVEILDTHIHTMPREGDELADGLDENVVKIMTVHAAKGLEFPIVFLLGLDAPAGGRSQRRSVLSDADFGFALRTPGILRRSNTDEGLPYALLSRRRELADLAEAKRLLYVACTRAQCHLFLVGRADKPPPTESWQRWIVDGLGLGDVVEGGRESHTLELDDEAAVRIARESPSDSLSVPPRKRLHATEPSPAADGGRLDVERLARMLAPIAAEKHRRAFSVTELVDFARCPRLYCARYVLGLVLDERPMSPEETTDELTDTEDGDGDRRALGQVVHRLLERLAADPSTDLNQTALNAARHEALDDGKARQLAEQAAKIVLDFRKSDLGATLLGSSGFSELAFALRLNDVIVRGRVDRLLEGPPPFVVDFKLPAQPAKATRSSLEQSYGVQLRAYALAVSRLLRTDRVRTAIVLPETRASFEWEYGGDRLAQIEQELVERVAAITSASFSDLIASGAGCGRCIVCRTMPVAPTRA